MMRRKSKWAIVAMLAAGAALAGRAQAADKKPNIVHIVAAANPAKVVEPQKRLDALAKDAAKPLFLQDQFKVVMKNLQGEPIIPTDEGFDEGDLP